MQATHIRRVRNVAPSTLGRQSTPGVAAARRTAKGHCTRVCGCGVWARVCGVRLKIVKRNCLIPYRKARVLRPRADCGSRARLRFTLSDPSLRKSHISQHTQPPAPHPPESQIYSNTWLYYLETNGYGALLYTHTHTTGHTARLCRKSSGRQKRRKSSI